MTARDSWRADRARYGPRAWIREPTIFAVGLYRLNQHLRTRRTPAPLRAAVRLLSVWVGTLVGVEIPPEAQFGPGLRVHHGGAVVVHASTVAGRACTLRQGVTLGERRVGGGVPVLGDGVDIGAHAQVLGPIRIGDGARIGALALVLDDVSAGGTAVAPRAEIRQKQSPTAAPPSSAP